MGGILHGKPQQTQASLIQEFQQLRAKYIPAGDPNPDAATNKSSSARRYLVSVVLDHVGQAELVEWARPLGML
jgi:hypothetical protein